METDHSIAAGAGSAGATPCSAPVQPKRVGG